MVMHNKTTKRLPESLVIQFLWQFSEFSKRASVKMTNSNLTKNTLDTDLDALLSLIDQYQVVVVEVAVVFIFHRSFVLN